MAVNAVTLYGLPYFQGKNVTLVHDANDLTHWEEALGGKVGSIRLYGSKIEVFAEADWKGCGKLFDKNVDDLTEVNGLDTAIASFYFSE